MAKKPNARALALTSLTDIPRGGADQSGDGMLFHVLAHVDPHNVLLVIEQLMSQRLGEFRLAHSRRAEEPVGKEKRKKSSSSSSSSSSRHRRAHEPAPWRVRSCPRQSGPGTSDKDHHHHHHHHHHHDYHDYHHHYHHHPLQERPRGLVGSREPGPYHLVMHHYHRHHHHHHRHHHHQHHLQE
jgi:hypothetical protein